MKLHQMMALRSSCVVFLMLPFFNLSNSKELREGGKILTEKLKKYKPLIAVFNGKCKQFHCINSFLFPSSLAWKLNMNCFFFLFQVFMKCSAENCLVKSQKNWSLVCSQRRSQTVTW